MAPTSELERGNTLTVAEFYDALAPDYDAMTGFLKRFVKEKPFFRLFVEKHRISAALDAGCGTGFHALLLAQLGVHVTGVDVSTAMIARAQRHAQELSLPVRFVAAHNAELGRLFDRQFDAVFCLGNTMAHLLSEEDLCMTLRSFHAILKPGGVLLLQNLNYDRILADRERIQSVKEVNGTTFVRFYDFKDSLITFNILTLDRRDGEVCQSLRTVSLKPLQSNYLSNLLEQSGFSRIKLFGGIAMDSYQARTSRDLVVLASKGQ